MISHPGESSAGARAMALVNALARHTDEPGRLTRLYLSPAHRATAEATLAMMREAGLEARIDAAGNVIGRREGRERGAPALIIGSHLDSVVDAGRFEELSPGRAEQALFWAEDFVDAARAAVHGDAVHRDAHALQAS